MQEQNTEQHTLITGLWSTTVPHIMGDDNKQES